MVKPQGSHVNVCRRTGGQNMHRTLEGYKRDSWNSYLYDL